MQPIVRDIGLERGFQRRHLQQAQVWKTADLLTQALIGRIIALVVANHERDIRMPGRLDHRPAFGHGKAHGLLDQQMLAGRRGGDGDLRMTAGGQDQDRIQRGREKILPTLEGARHAIVVGAARTSSSDTSQSAAISNRSASSRQLMEVHHAGQ